jgi:prepilin signal peptidase PulO-like enzyme (type II secretory pathway)
LALFGSLTIVAIFDARSLIIPDLQLLLLLALGLVTKVCNGCVGLGDGVAGAAIAYVGMRLLCYGFARCRGQQGIGEGDAINALRFVSISCFVPA